MMHLDTSFFLGLLCAGASCALLTPSEAHACQPEPATGYVVATIPADGGKTGITNAALDLIPPIALRWSNAEADERLGQFYDFGHGGQDIPVDEEVATSFEVTENATGASVPGTVVQGKQEVRFVPDYGALNTNSAYTANVQFRDGDTYSWSFETTSDPSYMDMPFPFAGIKSTTLQEKAYPTYTYCPVDFDDPEFTCYPARRQSGWNYRPSLYIEFDATTSFEHGPMLFRYALHVHSSEQDTSGQLVRYVDVVEEGTQTIEIESPEKSGDSYCYSLHHLYAYEHDAQNVAQSEIVCHPASDLITIQRLAIPDTDPLPCEQGNTDGDMGGDMDGEGGSPDMGGSGGGGGGTNPDMDEAGQGTKGWMLSDQDDDSVDDEGCGCASSPGSAPNSGGVMLLVLGLLGGFWRRRRAR